MGDDFTDDERMRAERALISLGYDASRVIVAREAFCYAYRSGGLAALEPCEHGRLTPNGYMTVEPFVCFLCQAERRRALGGESDAPDR